MRPASRALARQPALPAAWPKRPHALARDSVLMTALGPPQSAAYLAVKRSEVANFAERNEISYDCL